MPKSRPDNSDSLGEGPEQPPQQSDISAADLRRQVTLLAEQVRRLGAAEAEIVRGSGEAKPADLPLPPAPRPRRPTAIPEQPSQPVGATEAPVLESARAAEPAAPPAPRAEGEQQRESPAPALIADQGLAERSDRLVESVITLAEMAAAEIRASARLQAAAIRAGASGRLTAPATSEVLMLLDRQRRMLSALSAQTERLERNAAVVRAQIRALDAERRHMRDILAPRPQGAPQPSPQTQPPPPPPPAPR